MIIEIKNGYINTEHINYIESIKSKNLDDYSYKVYFNNNTAILISEEDFDCIRRGYNKAGLWSDKGRGEYVPPPRTTNPNTTGELRNNINELF